MKSRRFLHMRAWRPPHRTPHRQGGVALIEVLVALLIFMLGVLGLIGLQGAMTRAQTESKLRTEAAYLASEAIARLWTDLGHLATYHGSNCATPETPCREWQDKVVSTLPGGQGAISIDTATGDVAVTVTWALPGGQTHQFVTRTTISPKGS